MKKIITSLVILNLSIASATAQQKSKKYNHKHNQIEMLTDSVIHTMFMSKPIGECFYCKNPHLVIETEINNQNKKYVCEVSPAIPFEITSKIENKPIKKFILKTYKKVKDYLTKNNT